MEASAELGLPRVLAGLDITKFYDSVDWHKLAPRALACGYPAPFLALAIQAHTAPRIIVVGPSLGNG